MADYGARYTDKRIRETDRKIRETYKTAQRELKKKLAAFNARFAQQDQKKRQQVKNGELSKQEYKDWLTGQVFMRNQWKSSLREVSQVLMHSNQQALNVINNGRLDVFAENYNFMAFKGEGSTGISFGIYNTQAVARLLEEEPQILPEWKIDEEKDYEWNYKKVNNIVQQGIIQGEGVKEITDRLCTDLCTQNENKMCMFARTAYTGAQNAGRQEQMNDAADMGLEVHKQWLATLDNRTRDTHRMLDGEEVNYNENFSNDLEYPGDPEGDPAEVYNCRCTMVTIYPKYEDRSKPDWREEQDIDGQSYEEWKEEARERIAEKEEKSRRDNSSGLTKEDEKILAQYRNTNTKQSEEDKKQVSEIAKRLSDEGFIANGYKADIEGMDAGLAKSLMTAFERMCERFPMLKGRIQGIELADPKSFENRYSFASCDSFNGGNLRLNRMYFTDPAFFEKVHSWLVDKGVYPKGTTIESIMYHELGHALDGVLSADSMRGRDDSYSKMMFDLVLNKNGHYDSPVFSEESIATRLGTNATKNIPFEWFADSISVMMTVSKEKQDDIVRGFELLLMNM